MRRNALKTLTQGAGAGSRREFTLQLLRNLLLFAWQRRVLSICGRGTWLPKSIVANNCHINNPSLLSTRAYAFLEGLNSNLFVHVLKGCMCLGVCKGVTFQ